MSIASSPNMRLLYGLDESGIKARRLNSAEANLTVASGDYHLDTDDQLSTGEGCPVETDGRGGKACSFARPPTYPDPPWTDNKRWLVSSDRLGSVMKTDGAIYDMADATADGDGGSFGGRFKQSDQATSAYPLLSIGLRTVEAFFQRMRFSWTNGGGGHFQVTLGATTVTVNNAGVDSTTGSPHATHYIEADKWYSWGVRHYYIQGSDTAGVKIWLYDEAAATLYTWTKEALSPVSTGAPASVLAASDCVVLIGAGAQAGSLSPEGPVDQFWYYVGNLPESDMENVVIGGLSIPWVEPDYYREGHEVHSALTKENADYPLVRPLPTGGTVVRHPVDVLAQEIRTRLEGFKTGQPWALRAIDYIFDPAGPYGSQRARKGERPDLSIGVWRQPGQKPWGACEDARNIEFTYAGPRRRRGFKIRRDVDSSMPTGHNAFWTWRSYDDELFRAYKVGTSIYLEEGNVATAISTGWQSSHMPAAFFLDDRLVILSQTTGILLDGTTTPQDFGVAAPTSISPAASGGGTLNASYYYAATLYDPTTGDESGPVVSSVVTPAVQKVTLTLPATAPEARFTQYRIYRTNADGSVPNLFLIDTITVAASYDDTGEPDGSMLLPQVTDADGTFLDYITGAAPDTFAIGIAHKERAIYAKGGTNPDRVYIYEPNEPLRNYAAQWIAADGPVRALASWQGRVVIFTDNTVEIVESDFIRDTNGELNVNRTVVSRSVGALGQNGVIVFQGQMFWLDRRGVFTLQGTEAVPVTDRIADLFPYTNTNLGQQIVGGWNHLTRTLWWTLPNSDLQDDSTQMQTQFVMPVDSPDRWWFHDLEATFVGQFDDDQAGQRFGLIDHAGVFKELHSYEGDGQQGNETGTYEDDGTDDFGGSPAGITSIAGSTIAVEGSPGWTVDEHRGKGLVLRDRSTRKIYYYTIRSNTAAGLTVDRDPNSALAAGDGYYIGGMNAFLQFAGYDFGSPNRKVVRQVQYTFADLTREELYL